jgi:hypothetical protein
LVPPPPLVLLVLPLDEDGALSLFAGGALSDFAAVSLAPESALFSPAAAPFAALAAVVAGVAERLSVLYQPDPLNTIPAGKSTRRTFPPHSGHSVTGGSENR